MAADEELTDDQLPSGHTPVWIEAPPQTTRVDMLKRVETMVGEYNDVVVLYRDDFYHDSESDSDNLPPARRRRLDSISSDDSDDSDVDLGAKEWCAKRGWKFLEDVAIFGCEAQCLVLLDCGLDLELITRARNMLIIVER